MRDFYYTLGADTTATKAEIKEAYRKLSKKFHPDLNPDDEYFESRFMEIQEAYEVLSDPIKRNRYDKALNQFKASYQEYKPLYQNYKASPLTGKSKTRGLDIVFTFVLFLLILIFGTYIIKILNGSKTTVANKTAPVIVVPLDKAKHHKKKHNSITKITATVIPSPIKPDTINQASSVQSTSIINQPAEASTDILYTTYLRSNLTGVVNMHESDNLSSKIIRAIPTNSIVSVIEKEGSYYKVSYNGDIGYVPKWTVKTK
ncbi:SH3 domain-containing protein [Mucilaginibacter mallensis]|uniref:SH3 domain-containing protein n=1 Tax=Mucilaginibacter mallensis TaxID=652787 RepID=A0A1H1WG05_MUCMA|nr:SH3 domain-containing protein [Mucilaginibacter mallensis]SDS95561.1 SH3 domain-containing protein [Mucilaginibacter mallensis]